MSHLRQAISIFLLIVCSAGSAAFGGEWPQFLGPEGTGVVEKGEKVARSWPAGGPKELWKLEVNEGFGGASIAGGKVFFLDRQNDREVLRVLDLKTGKPLWEQGYDSGRFGGGGYPGTRSTPTVDGNRVYTVGATGQVYCFDVKAKKVVWNKSLRNDFGAKVVDWGFAQSPLLVGDKIVVSAAGGPNGLVALNRNTGATIWKTPVFGENDTYTSPMLTTLAGEQQIVMWHRGVLAGFNPKSGAKIWEYKWRTNRPIPQPLAIGDGKFFLTIGYGGGCAMIRVTKSDKGTWSVTEIFQDERSGSKVPPALFYRGHIYTSDDNGRGFQCFDADGNLKWQTRGKPEFGLGSLIIADGVIFIVNGKSGDLVMAEACPDGYKELGRTKVLGGKDIWAPLALSDGMLVLRDHSQMKCLYVGAEGAGGVGE